MTILSYYGMKAVTGYGSKHGITEGMPVPDQLVGLELEIENFSTEHDQRFGGFTFTADGSLRASETGIGIEAITMPVATKHVPHLLNAFFTKFGIRDTNYSERCSTHVHFNVQPLEFEQLTTLCLLYQTVERMLFRFVGHNRGDGIFCVPWSQSNLSYNIVNALEKGALDFRRWQKYSALNLIPVATQGTVEFRHLHGTCDVKLITEWVSILSCMFRYAMANPLEKVKDSILNMNTVSNYREWGHSVFGNYFDLLQGEHTELDLSTGVIDSKLMLMTPGVKNKSATDGMEAILARIAAEDALRARAAPANIWTTTATTGFGVQGQAAQVGATAQINRDFPFEDRLNWDDFDPGPGEDDVRVAPQAIPIPPTNWPAYSAAQGRAGFTDRVSGQARVVPRPIARPRPRGSF